VQSGDKYK